MKLVVIGGTGLIGSRLVTFLRCRGHDALAAAPARGVNTITGDGLAMTLAGADVAIDVSNSPSLDGAVATRFFETSSRNLLAAAASAGVRHHIVLSVVGTDRLQESAYFRGKLLQEGLVRASGIPYTILRSTQFFEFMRRIAESGSDGRTVRVPIALVQPTLSDEVVTALADVALGFPANDTVEVAGPEKFLLDDVVRQVLSSDNDARGVTADAAARYFGAQLEQRTLMPGDNAWITATRFASWLARASSAQPEAQAV